MQSATLKGDAPGGVGGTGKQKADTEPAHPRCSAFSNAAKELGEHQKLRIRLRRISTEGDGASNE